jgi:periplasmic protein TonB
MTRAPAYAPAEVVAHSAHITRPLRVGLLGSVVVHALAIGALWLGRSPAAPALPPVYQVELIGAPAAAAPASVAPATPVATDPTPAASPRPAPAKAAGAKAPPPAKAVKGKAVAPAPNPAKAASAAAQPSGGAAPAAAPLAAAPASVGGGTGTDVATVRTEGIAFPFPGYLQNIVRQVAARFRPRNPSAPLKADVAFLLHRDGTVSNIRFVTRSGSYAFDLEAQGAIEAAASARAFGALPSGFPDDVLPVTFAFDPRLGR